MSKTAILYIKGMTCGHCKNAVTNLLKEEKGIENVEVDLEKGLATVNFEPELTTAENLAKAVNDGGIYTASLN